MVKHLFSKIALTIYFLIAISLAFWGYTVFKDRDGKIPSPSTANNTSSQDIPNNPSPASNVDDSNNQTNQNDQQTAPDQQNQDQQTNPTQNTAPTTSFAKITPEICDSQCKQFKKDKVKLEYCQQVCGISTNTDKNNEDCSKLTALNKDYCLKSSAIQKHDPQICQQISDFNLRNTCSERVFEDLMEIEKQQNPGPNQAPVY